jgi:BirA family biotin operon repressor/biotin-[acetyl-CoA-carboxylase] ligase
LSAGGRLLALHRQQLRLNWRLRVHNICASTETELSRWLAQDVCPPVAVLSRRQRHGQGQHGRHWQSPNGGLWLSAAVAWPSQHQFPAAQGLPRLLVTALAAELAPLGLNLGDPLRIKPPNDLMVGERKLAGVLTAIAWRGAAVRHLRFGIGLNGRHPIRPPGISLEQLLGSACPPWEGLVGVGMRALERMVLDSPT